MNPLKAASIFTIIGSCALSQAQENPTARVIPPASVGFEYRFEKKGLTDKLTAARLTESDLPWEIGPYVTSNGKPRYYIGREFLAYTSRNSKAITIRAGVKIELPHGQRSTESVGIDSLLNGNVISIDGKADKRADLVVLLTGEPREILVNFVTAESNHTGYQLLEESGWIARVAVRTGSEQPKYLTGIPLNGAGRLHFRMPEGMHDSIVQGVHFVQGDRLRKQSVLFLDDFSMPLTFEQ